MPVGAGVVCPVHLFIFLCLGSGGLSFKTRGDACGLDRACHALAFDSMKSEVRNGLESATVQQATGLIKKNVQTQITIDPLTACFPHRRLAMISQVMEAMDAENKDSLEASELMRESG